MLRTPSGHVLPLAFHDGLARLPLRPYTDEEFSRMPHINMTLDAPWSPLAYDQPARSQPPLPVSRIQQIHITTGTSSAAWRLRYKFLTHTAVTATSTNCLHSCEDDIYKVLQHEQETLQVTKWDWLVRLEGERNASKN